jgi:succinyl-diaminopimelate desuccinylase
MDKDHALTAAIEARRDEIVALTQALVRIPTLNPPGLHYREICELLGARLSDRGFAVELVRAHGAPADSDRYPRWNMVARIEGTRPGDCVHFNGHHDVVETGHGWTTDPFGGEVRDGRVYGRGTCDMKGGIAASVIAAEAFLDTHPDFAGAIEISATADEESGGYGGVAYLSEKGYFDPSRVQHVIIPEPLNKDRICLGHRGVWWAEIETKGRIAHGSMPFLGDCAVRHMGAVLAEMEATLFPLLAGKRTEMPVVPEGARSSTLNINAIHGGEPDRTPITPACPRLACPTAAASHRPPFPDRGGHRRGEGRGHGAHGEGAAERPDFDYEIRDLFEVQPDHDRPRGPGRAHRSGGDRTGPAPAGGVRRLPRHLRSETHRPDRADEELHRLWAGHPRPRAPARRMGGDRRHGGQCQGHGTDAS